MISTTTFARLGTIIIGIASFPLVAFASEEPEWHIDTRVELASVLCRLAGYPEYQDMRVPGYDKAVNEYFAPYRNHPAVRLMARLQKERDLSHNAIPGLALLASDARTLKPRVPLHPLPSSLDSRWDEASATAFLKAARQFAKDTRADAFFRNQAALYSAIERAYREQFAGRLDLAWYRNHFNVPKDTVFHGLPAPLTGAASYGIHVLLPGGRMELDAVLGLPLLRDGEPIVLPVEDASGLIVHEFCHPFVNPWVNAHAESLRAAGEKLFAELQETFRASAYSNWKSIMCESLVRAATIRYFLDHAKPSVVNFNLLDDRSQGFWWTEDLARVLETGGNSAVTLDALEPQIAAFFTEWATNPEQRVAAKKAELASQGPQIVSLSPRDGDTEVDARVEALEIRFDRPMGRNMSVRGDAPDVTGKPAWDETKTVLRIPVALRPGARYIMFFNRDPGDLGFRSETGELLAPRTWQFQVKE